MYRIKKSLLFKVVSLFVIFSFLALDVSWAYPQSNSSTYNLAVEVTSAQNMMMEASGKWKESIFAKERDLLLSVHKIARDLFQERIEFEKLRSRIEDWQAFYKLNITGGIGLDHIGPLSSFQKVIEEGYDYDFFPKFMPEDDVIVIPYKKADGKEVLILIADKNKLDPASLRGFDFTISDKYAIKEITKTEGTKEAPEIKPEEKPEVIISESVAEVPQPEGTKEKGVLARVPIKVKAILFITLFSMVFALPALAKDAARSAGQIEKTSAWSLAVENIIEAHPIVALVAIAVIILVIAFRSTIRKYMYFNDLRLPNGRDRTNAVNGLIKSGQKDVKLAEYLSELLASAKKYHTKAAAAEVLLNIGLDDHLSKIFAGDYRKTLMTYVLANQGQWDQVALLGSDAFSGLLIALQEEEMKLEAARTLGRIRDERAIEVLEELTGSNEEELALAAKEALSEIQRSIEIKKEIERNKPENIYLRLKNGYQGLIRGEQEPLKEVFIEIANIPTTSSLYEAWQNAIKRVSREYAIWTDNLKEKIDEVKGKLTPREEASVNEFFKKVRKSVKADRSEQWAVINAGGVGKRLWPVGYEHRPKQLLKFKAGRDIYDKGTLLQLAVERQTDPNDPNSVDPSHVIIVTTKLLEQQVWEQVKELGLNIPRENIICEPYGLNTGPALLLGALVAAKKAGKDGQDAIIRSLNADQRIPRHKEFNRVLQNCADFAKLTNAYVEIGVEPPKLKTGPRAGKSQINDQLGHQRIGGKDLGGGMHFLLERVEKPEFVTEQAKKEFFEDLMDKGAIWNSGCVVARVELLDLMMQTFHPVANAIFRKYKDNILDQSAIDAMYDELSVLNDTLPDGQKIKTQHDNLLATRATKGDQPEFDTVCATGLLKDNWDDVGNLYEIRNILGLEPGENFVASGRDDDITIAEDKGAIGNTVYATEDGTKITLHDGVENMIVAYEAGNNSLLLLPAAIYARAQDVPQDVGNKENKLGKLVSHVKGKDMPATYVVSGIKEDEYGNLFAGGAVFLKDCRNCSVFSNRGLVAAVGVEGYTVIWDGDRIDVFRSGGKDAVRKCYYGQIGRYSEPSKGGRISEQNALYSLFDITKLDDDFLIKMNELEFMQAHSRRVKEITQRLAQELQITEEKDTNLLKYLSLVHDIGVKTPLDKSGYVLPEKVLDEKKILISKELRLLLENHNNYEAFIKKISADATITENRRKELARLLVIFQIADSIERGNNKPWRDAENKKIEDFDQAVAWIEKGHYGKDKTASRDRSVLDVLVGLIKRKDEAFLGIISDARQSEELSPEDVAFIEKKEKKKDEVSLLFEAVDTHINNRRARLVARTAEMRYFLSSIAPFTIYNDVRNLSITVNTPTAELVTNISKVLEIMKKYRQDKVLPAAYKEAVDEAEKELAMIQVDSIASGMLTLAKEYKDQQRKLVVAIDTSWIPGYEKGQLQHTAMNAVLNNIGLLKNRLKVANLEIIIGKDDSFASEVLDAADLESRDFSNMIILASNNIIDNELGDLKTAPGVKGAYLGSVDTRELDDKKLGDFETYFINMVEMLNIMMEVAVGKKCPTSPVIELFDEVNRLIMFLPKAEVMEYEQILWRNEALLQALQAV